MPQGHLGISVPWGQAGTHTPPPERTAQGSPLPEKERPREDPAPGRGRLGSPLPTSPLPMAPPALPRVPAPTSGSPGMRVAAVPVARRAVQLIELILHVEHGAAHPFQDPLHPRCVRPCGEETSALPIPGGDRETEARGHNSSWGTRAPQACPYPCWPHAARSLVPPSVPAPPASGSSQVPRPGWAKPWPWSRHLEVAGGERGECQLSRTLPDPCQNVRRHCWHPASEHRRGHLADTRCPGRPVTQHPGDPRATSPPAGTHRSAPRAPRPPA